MDRRAATAAAKERIEEYLYQRGIDPRREFHCLNPGHQDRHPSMKFDPRRHKVHCFACGVSYDVFDLIAMDYNLEGKAVFDKAFEIFGIQADDTKTPPSTGKKQRATTTGEGTHKEPEKPETDNTPYYLQCKARITETDYHRGISLEVLERHWIGSDTNFRTRDGYTNEFVTWERVLIIPRSRGSYVVRNCDPAAGKKNRYRIRGGEALFNPTILQTATKPIYIVEGELDAMSIETAGGEAIGLGSAVNWKLLKAAVEKQRPTQPLVIALDNEAEPGTKAIIEDAEKELRAAFDRLRIPYCVYHPYGAFHDANEALNGNQQEFEEHIAHGEAEAMKAMERQQQPDTETLPGMNLYTVEEGRETMQPGEPGATPKPYEEMTEAEIEAAEREYREVSDAIDAEEREAKEAAEKEAREAAEREAEKEAYIKATSAGACLQTFLDGISASLDTPPIPTGFKTLDDCLDGGLYEGLAICGAITSLGKTALIMQIADNVAAAGHDVLVFALEMAKAELIARSISRHTIQFCLEDGLNTNHAKTGRGITDGRRYANYSGAERRLIERAELAYAEYAEHIYICEGIGDIGIRQIRKTVEKHVRLTGRRPLVIVDYLQILAPYNERWTDKQNTDKAVLELKRLSRDYKIPVIALSSLNRMGYKDKVGESSFKESGAIEYGCDVLLGMYLKGAGTQGFDVNTEKKRNPRRIELVIIKNRQGKTGDIVSLSYYPMFNYFKDIEDKGLSL